MALCRSPVEGGATLETTPGKQPRAVHQMVAGSTQFRSIAPGYRLSTLSKYNEGVSVASESNRTLM